MYDLSVMQQDRTIFERVWDGSLPSWPIFKSDAHGIQVLLDIYPAHPGHLLVIPREPIDHVFDLEPHRHLQLFAVAKLASERLKEVLGPRRVKYAVSGYDIPHVHLHLLPSYARGDVEEAFEARPKIPVSEMELNEMRQRLQFTAEQITRAEHQLALLAAQDLEPPKGQAASITAKPLY
jgi:histidine triad (HIT) family protein